MHRAHIIQKWTENHDQDQERKPDINLPCAGLADFFGVVERRGNLVQGVKHQLSGAAGEVGALADFQHFFAIATLEFIMLYGHLARRCW